MASIFGVFVKERHSVTVLLFYCSKAESGSAKKETSFAFFLNATNVRPFDPSQILRAHISLGIVPSFVPDPVF